MPSTSWTPFWRLAACLLALLVARPLSIAADDAGVIEACLKSADADSGKPHDCIGRVADAAHLLGLSRKGLFLKRRRAGLT